MTRKDYAAYQQSVQAFMTREGIKHLSTAHIKCPECEVAFVDDHCPKCKKPVEDFPIEPYPSKRRCDCCDTSEYGDRMDANSCDSEGNIKEYCICTDCEYYVEYGRLDDTQMQEIEDDTDDRYTFDELEEGMTVKWRGKAAKVTTLSHDFVQLQPHGSEEFFRLYDTHVNGGEVVSAMCYGVDG